MSWIAIAARGELPIGLDALLLDKETRRLGDKEHIRRLFSPCLPISPSPCLARTS